MKEPYLSIVGLIALAIVIYIIYKLFKRWGKKIEQKTDENFRKMAELLELKFERASYSLPYTDWKPPTLLGHFNGNEITVSVINESYGDEDHQLVLIEVKLAKPMIYFEVNRNSRASEFFRGRSKIDFKDELFSKNYFVRTTDTATLLKILNTEIRASFIAAKEIFDLVRKLKSRNNVLSVRYPTIPHNDKGYNDVVTIVRLLLNLASVG